MTILGTHKGRLPFPTPPGTAQIDSNPVSEGWRYYLVFANYKAASVIQEGDRWELAFLDDWDNVLGAPMALQDAEQVGYLLKYWATQPPSGGIPFNIDSERSDRKVFDAEGGEL
jgi:hypothetical protein